MYSIDEAWEFYQTTKILKPDSLKREKKQIQQAFKTLLGKHFS